MIHLHLIGYTADLDHLVLDLDDEDGRGRYRVVIDGDLFATLDEVRDQRLAAGKDVGVWPPAGHVSVAALEGYLEDDLEITGGEPAAATRPSLTPGPAPSPGAPPRGPRDAASQSAAEDDLYAELEDVEDVEPPAVRIVARADTTASTSDDASAARSRLLFDDDDDDDWDALVAEADEPAPDSAGAAADRDEPIVPERVAVDADPNADAAVAGEASRLERSADAQPTERRRADVQPTEPRAAALPDRRVPPAPLPTEPKLSPAEIQARLRAGRSPRSVAKAAGTDIAWIERWLPPILAERHRVLERAHGMRLERARLGPSRDPLGRAVERNLRDRDVDLDEVSWDVGRRQDGRWRVSVRFHQRGRSRSATWVLDVDDDALKAASDLARDLGFTRPAAGDRSSRSGG